MSAIILFDGVCNFCNGSVNFIIERDLGGYFKFAPLQSEIGAQILAENGIDKTQTDSVILIEDGKTYIYSTAALRVARRLDGFWKYFYALVVVPRPIRDFFYKLFAKHRYRLFGKKEACMLPTPEIRARFFGDQLKFMDILGNKPENEDIDMLVCVAAESEHRPVYGSVRAVCGQCKTPVWVSVSGQKALRERKTLRPFCMKCAHENIIKSDEKPKAEIVEGAIDELRRHFLKINEN